MDPDDLGSSGELPGYRVNYQLDKHLGSGSQSYQGRPFRQAHPANLYQVAVRDLGTRCHRVAFGEAGHSIIPSQGMHPGRNITYSLVVALGTWLCLTEVVAQGLPEAESPIFLLNTSLPRSDRDSDGLPDAFEEAAGLNPDVADANADPDGDGRTNLEEYNAGTPPKAADFPAASALASAVFVVDTRVLVLDSDGDGMPDWWEVQNGLDKLGSNSFADPDGDGFSNLQEWNSGTDPMSPDLGRESSSVSGVFALNTAQYSHPVTQDTDLDGMPDWWEQKYGLQLTVKDAALDPDNDGLSNLAEFLAGTHPAIDEAHSDAYAVSALFLLDSALAPADSDGDGMRDWWEIANGLDPKIADATGDPDGDGRTNIEEYNSGTNPLLDDWKGPSDATSPLFLVATRSFADAETLDSDEDGMPDWWELEYGLDPRGNDAWGDMDRDGIPNLAEYNSGNNPGSSDDPSAAALASSIFLVDTGGRSYDTDRDGIPDWWEKVYMLGITNCDPGADLDSDGANNLSEYRAGTNPNDSQSAFRIVSILRGGALPPGTLRITWSSVANQTYSILGSSSAEGPFSVIVSNVIGQAGLQTFDVTFAGDRFFLKVETMRTD